MTSIPKPPIPVPAARSARAADDRDHAPPGAVRMPSDVSPLAPAPAGDGLAAMRARFLDDFASASAERLLFRRPGR